MIRDQNSCEILSKTNAERKPAVGLYDVVLRRSDDRPTEFGVDALRAVDSTISLRDNNSL